MSDSAIVRFSDDDLACFSAASGDRNPLHLDPLYASRTAYGQRVVFGALGCLASLRGLNRPVKRLVVDFLRPMFVGVNYRLEQIQSEDGATCRVLDGSTPVLNATLKFAEGQVSASPHELTGRFGRNSAATLDWEHVTPGAEISGEWSAEASSLKELYRRWGLQLEDSVIRCLLWSSYFVGMEAPGESALFFRATFDFARSMPGTQPWRYVVRVASKNPSLMQMRSGYEIRSEADVVATGQLTAFYRPAVSSLQIGGELHADDRENNLRGKTAIVIGASRGLGAALAASLALDGAKVVAVSRTASDWLPQLPASARSRIQILVQDASDPAAMASLAADVESEHGRLDFLLCSAFPAIPSLRLEPSASDRVSEYVKRAMDLVVAPLCGFLPLLERSAGTAILISSVAVEEPVRDWPHYVAAKSASEQLFRIAPMQFPKVRSLIIRPNRLLTEMTNTPMGRQGAAEPFAVARQITMGLAHTGSLGSFQVLTVEQLAERMCREQVQPIAG